MEGGAVTSRLLKGCSTIAQAVVEYEGTQNFTIKDDCVWLLF